MYKAQVFDKGMRCLKCLHPWQCFFHKKSYKGGKSGTIRLGGWGRQRLATTRAITAFQARGADIFQGGKCSPLNKTLNCGVLKISGIASIICVLIRGTYMHLSSVSAVRFTIIDDLSPLRRASNHAMYYTSVIYM